MNKDMGRRQGTGRPGEGRPRRVRPGRTARSTVVTTRRLYGDEVAGSPLSAQTLAVARRLYETTQASQASIARTLGVNETTIHRQARLNEWQRPAVAVEQADGCGLVCPGLDACPVRSTMHRRLYAGLERRLREAEAAQSGDAAGPAADGPARERETRSLASLARTLDKLAAMDRAAARATIEAAAAAAALAPLRTTTGPLPSTADEEAPYDVEELRRELARRLDRLLEAGEAG